MAKEPSILDYLKSILRNDQNIVLGDYIHIEGKKKHANISKKKKKKKNGKKQAGRIQWQVVIGSLTALIAQSFLEPDHKQITFSIVLYVLAGIILWKGYKRSSLSEFDTPYADKPFSSDIRLFYFSISMVFLVLAFLFFNENTFTWRNLLLWSISIIFFILSVWEKNDQSGRNKIV